MLNNISPAQKLLHILENGTKLMLVKAYPVYSKLGNELH